MIKSLFYVMAALIVMTGNEAVTFSGPSSAETEIGSDSSRTEEETENEGTETETETEGETEAETETETEAAPVITKISQQEAVMIAEKEAEKECYDYQGWDSLFKVNGTPTLCMTEEELLQAAWARYGDLKGDDPSYYEGRPIWSMRLIDEHDALTSLFLYVDAETGEILGYRTLSD